MIRERTLCGFLIDHMDRFNLKTEDWPYVFHVFVKSLEDELKVVGKLLRCARHSQDFYLDIMVRTRGLAISDKDSKTKDNELKGLP